LAEVPKIDHPTGCGFKFFRFRYHISKNILLDFSSSWEKCIYR